MAGIRLSLSNMFQLMAILSPILIAFFMIMLSFMNQNVKGIIFIAGVSLSIFLNHFLQTILKSPVDPNASLSCTLIDIPFLTGYNSPSHSSLFISFTIAYLFLPMIYNNQMNYAIVSALLGLLSLDCISKINKNCSTKEGSILGIFVGLILGGLWYAIFHVVGADNLLYFDEMDSNAVLCEKPSKQTFKCSVYKNGMLVSSNIA